MRPKIYLFGDSITEASFSEGGWGAALANHFSRTVDVVLRGYSGYNTRWALRVSEKVFPPIESSSSDSTLAATLFFGANDACLSDRYSGFQHVPLDEYKRNLVSIVSLFKERWPDALILLITPPPIDEKARLLYPYVDNPGNLLERTNDAAGDYAKACIEAADECGYPVIDLWTKMQEFPDWRSTYLSDGLHLTPAGNEVVFREVVKKLTENGLSPESLPVDLPLLSEIDVADPIKSFSI